MLSSSCFDWTSSSSENTILNQAVRLKARIIKIIFTFFCEKEELMENPKYIVIEEELKKELDKNKIIPRERYNEVIARLIDENSKTKQEEFLNLENKNLD